MMAFENSFKTEKICRTCLAEDNNMKSIFSFDGCNGESIKLCEMLMSCTSIQVTRENYL